MHAQSVCTRCFLHALEGPGDEASTTAFVCTEKSCQALLQFYVQTSNGSHSLYIFPVWMLLSITCGQYDDNSSTYYIREHL